MRAVATDLPFVPGDDNVLQLALLLPKSTSLDVCADSGNRRPLRFVKARKQETRENDFKPANGANLEVLG